VRNQALLVDGTVDLTAGLVVRGLLVEKLSDTARACLAYMVREEGRTVPRDELLCEVWGYLRGVRSRAVDTVVKLIRKAVEVDPAAPRHLLTERGIGYRWASARRAVPPSSSLVGRDAELGWLAGATSRLLVVAGPPGIGKSALAASTGRRVVDLAGVHGPAAALRRLGAELFPGAGLATVPELARHIRSGGPRELCIDHPEEAGPALAEALTRLTESTKLGLLVATRDLRGWGGEVRVLRTLRRADAKTLLIREAGSDVPGVDSLLTVLEGLPLALVVAGRTLRRAPPESLLALPEAWLDGALRGSLEICWRGMDPELGRALGMLSLFEAGFSSAAARGVVGDGVAGAIGWLLDRGLVHWTGDRFRILRPIRARAIAALAPKDLETGREAVVAWLASTSAAAGPSIHRALDGYASDLEAALRRPEDPGVVGPLAHGLAALRYYEGDSAGMLRAAVVLASVDDPHWALHGALWRALDLLGRGHAGLASKDLKRVVLPEGASASLCFFHGSTIVRTRLLIGDGSGALSAAQELVRVALRAGCAEMVGRAWADVAMCARRAGEDALAREACDRALPLLQAVRERTHEARVLLIRGRMDLEAGATEEALERLRAGLDCGSPRLEAMVRVAIGEALAATGQRDEAIDALRVAWTMAMAFSDRNTSDDAEEALARMGCGPAA